MAERQDHRGQTAAPDRPATTAPSTLIIALALTSLCYLGCYAYHRSTGAILRLEYYRDGFKRGPIRTRVEVMDEHARFLALFTPLRRAEACVYNLCVTRDP